MQSRSTILYPTLSLAYRVTRWLDLGISGHLVLGSFDQTSVSYADLGQCQNVEYQPCDSRGTLSASATSFAATIGALARVSPHVGLGLSLRTPISLEAQGTFDPQAPRSAPIQIAAGSATLSTKLPMILRTGIRYVALDSDFELYDLELNFQYEGWKAAQGDGPLITIPELGQFKDIQTLIVHGYKDTFSIRAGGAYNMQAFDGIFTLRAGGYFDSAATSFDYTRLDFDTLAKFAGTLGLGYRYGAFSLDVAYAAVASVPRLVGTDQGQVRPVNGGKNGRPIDNEGELLPAVNEGAYRGFTHILSFGATLVFDELFGAPRPFHYGNSYEPGYSATAEEPKDKDKDKDKDGDSDSEERDREREREREKEREKDTPKKKKKNLELPPDEPALD